MENNDTVIINLDRPRELHCGHKALKRMSALTGKPIGKMDMEEFNGEDIEKIMFCLLEKDARNHGETLELSAMEDLLDSAKSYGEVIRKMGEAFKAAFDTEDNKPKNA